MRHLQTTIASTSLRQRPRGVPPVEEPRSRGGQAAALVITALAILMMVVL